MLLRQVGELQNEKHALLQEVETLTKANKEFAEQNASLRVVLDGYLGGTDDAAATKNDEIEALKASLTEARQGWDQARQAVYHLRDQLRTLADPAAGIRHPEKTDDLPALGDLKPLPTID